MTGDGEDVTMAADDDVVAKIRAHAAQLRGRDEVKVWTAADSESGPIDVAALSLARADAATRSLKSATPVEKPAAIPQNRDNLSHVDKLIHLDDLDDEVTIPAGDYRALLGLAPKATAVQAAPELVSHEDVLDEVTTPPAVHDDLIDEVTAPPVVHDDLIDEVTEPPVDYQPVAEVPPESAPVQPEPVQPEPEVTRPEVTRPEVTPRELVQPELVQPELEVAQPEPQPSGASLIGGMAPPEASTTFWTGEKQFRASGIDSQPRRERRNRFPLWIIVTLLILLIVAASVGIALAVAATGPAT